MPLELKYLPLAFHVKNLEGFDVTCEYDPDTPHSEGDRRAHAGVASTIDRPHPLTASKFNPLKCSSVRHLHLKVFNAIQV